MFCRLEPEDQRGQWWEGRPRTPSPSSHRAVAWHCGPGQSPLAGCRPVGRRCLWGAERAGAAAVGCQGREPRGFCRPHLGRCAGLGLGNRRPALSGQGEGGASWLHAASGSRGAQTQAPGPRARPAEGLDTLAKSELQGGAFPGSHRSCPAMIARNPSLCSPFSVLIYFGSQLSPPFYKFHK